MMQHEPGFVKHIPHHLKVDVELPFLPPDFSTIQLDMKLVEQVTFDNISGDELTPFAESASYGHGSHLLDDTLEDDERYYFGSVSNQWFHAIVAPVNVVVAVDPDGRTYPLVTEMNITRPFGAEFDYETGAMNDNPDVFVEKILYCEEGDSDYTFHHTSEELVTTDESGTTLDIREAYAQRMAELFVQNLSQREDLMFMHPKAQRAYKAHLQRKRFRKVGQLQTPGQPTPSLERWIP